MEVRIKLYVVLVFLCTLTNSYSQDTTEVVRDYTETALRDYAFCKCLEHSQDSVALKSFLHDKDRSAAGYFEVLPIDYDDFFMLDSLAFAKPRRGDLSEQVQQYAYIDEMLRFSQLSGVAR